MQNRKAGKIVSEKQQKLAITVEADNKLLDEDVSESGNIIHKKHKEHGECTEYIDRSDSLGGGGFHNVLN